MPNHRWTHMGHDLANRGETFFSTDAAGFIGYAAGPGVTFLDRYGLGDPLIARLPAEAPWRIGHFVREVPEGYRRNAAVAPRSHSRFGRCRVLRQAPDHHGRARSSRENAGTPSSG